MGKRSKMPVMSLKMYVSENKASPVELGPKFFPHRHVGQFPLSKNSRARPITYYIPRKVISRGYLQRPDSCATVMGSLAIDGPDSFQPSHVPMDGYSGPRRPFHIP